MAPTAWISSPNILLWKRAEPLFLLERLVMPEALAAHLDREAARLDLGHVDVRRGRVTGLVDRDRARIRRRCNGR